ncbi:DUF4157 domain-containing protein [Nocardioides sp. GY 10113]|uniref:eCIS core domain-containing protein n=1 Tax=Nocardioides sp. GY 10113 TaxID=2569761 RepID=UPI001981F4D5|nr:DUF4157 domain-containing protein [Nocardioides sp. GY 10113]
MPALVQRCGGPPQADESLVQRCGTGCAAHDEPPVQRAPEQGAALVQRCNGAPEPCPCHTAAPEDVARLDRHGGGPPPEALPAEVGAVLREPGAAIPEGLRSRLEEGFAGRLDAITPAPSPGRSRVSAPGDPSERQADALAREVASGPAATSGPRPDFSGVRIHTGPAAGRAARSIQASAYTVGQHVVLAEPAADTGSGRALLAHELTHVVQQARNPALAAGAVSGAVQRACGHDGKPTGCYAAPSLGKITLTDPSGGKQVHDIGDVVVDNMQQRFGGRFLPRVTVPASAKSTAHGFVDGLKVTQGSSLQVEIVEVKARSSLGGGCALADAEAEGYRVALSGIAADFVAVSKGLAKAGGLRVGEKQKPNAAARQLLLDVGATGTNPGRWRAWTFYNSVQNRLNTTFTAAFDGLDVAVNKDGTPGTEYVAGGPWTITCRRRGKAVPGTTTLVYEVSGKGGASYGCNKRCSDTDEERKRPQPAADATKRRSTDQRLRQEGDEEDVREPGEQPRVPGKQPADQPGDQPVVPPVRAPGQQPGDQPAAARGGDDASRITDLLVATAVLSAAAVGVREVAKRRALEKAYQATTAEIAKRGAPQLAKAIGINGVKLGSRQLSAKFEKEAVEALAKDLEKQAEKQLLKQAEKKAAKGVAKGVAKKVAGKVLSRAVPFLSIVLVASDALAMADHVAKGGTIEFGLGKPEADLKGDTDIKSKGNKGGAAAGELKDTKIDVTTTGVPNVSGTAEIQTENVTITGSVTGDGTPVTVAFKTKLKNTTITIKHGGVIKGGKVVLGGETTISDSQIEIDLPPGATVAASDKPVTLSGQKLKVTKVGTGGSGGAEQGKEGAGEGLAKPTEKPGGKAEEPPKVDDEHLKKVSEETRKRLDAAGQATKDLVVALLVTGTGKGVHADDKAVGAILKKLADAKATDAELAELKKQISGRAESLDQLLADLDAGIKGLRGKGGKGDDAEKAGATKDEGAEASTAPPKTPAPAAPPPKPVDPKDRKFQGLPRQAIRVSTPKDEKVGAVIDTAPAWGKRNGVPWEATVKVEITATGIKILGSSKVRTPTGTLDPWFVNDELVQLRRGKRKR